MVGTQRQTRPRTPERRAASTPKRSAGPTSLPAGGVLRPSDALALQRLAGNRAAGRLIRDAESGAVDLRSSRTSAVTAQRAPTAAPPTTATTTADEQALVRQWRSESGATENSLTDRLFSRRHPEAQGTALKPGSAAADEWVEIRNTVVRPVLAADPTAVDTTTAEPTTAPAQGTDGVDQQPGSTRGAGFDPIGAALKAGKDLFEFASDAGGAMIDAVAGLFGIAPETVEDADAQQPEVVVDVPVDVPAHQRGDAFKNQRDNESAHVEAGVSCSPTSFTMALIDLHSGDEETVRARAIELIKERGGNSEYGQTEELIIELLQVVDWKKATTDKPAYFWDAPNWAAWAAKTYGGKYYKDPNAQQYVASLFPATGGTGAETHSKCFTREQWEPVITALAGGAVASAEGKFTSSGHVVDIVDADDSGVTINDPYGLWLKGTSYQIRNGDKAPKLAEGDRATLERRATTNPEILAVYNGSSTDQTEDDGSYAAWGRRNFYSWEDVQTVQLGKWISVLRRA